MTTEQTPAESQVEGLQDERNIRGLHYRFDRFIGGNDGEPRPKNQGQQDALFRIAAVARDAEMRITEPGVNKRALTLEHQRNFGPAAVVPGAPTWSGTENTVDGSGVVTRTVPYSSTARTTLHYESATNQGRVFVLRGNDISGINSHVEHFSRMTHNRTLNTAVSYTHLTLPTKA